MRTLKTILLALALLLSLADGGWAATIVVTSTADTGAGTLRNAVAAANAGDTITFDPSLSGQTILLSFDITIGKNLTIDGSALANPVQLNGNQATFILSVNGGVTVSINSLIITNGLGANSGGINNAGNLILNNSTVVGNKTSGGFGCIYSLMGTLTLNNTTVANNSGPGIYSYLGNLTLSNSTVANNVATNGNSGGIYSFQGVIALNNSTVANNTYSNLSTSAGGIYANQGGVTLNNSVVTNNVNLTGGSGGVSHGESGTLSVNNSIVANNVGTGLTTFDSTLIVSNSIIVGNIASSGGGIGGSESGTMTLYNSIVASNSATGTLGGGGINIFGITLTLNNTTVANNNSASGGGGIYMNGGVLTANNSTIANNTASQFGGGIYNFSNSRLTLNNSTVANNSANIGGGIESRQVVFLTNSIVCSNTAASSGANIDPTLSSTNLLTSLVDTNALLAPLGNYGGPTQTMPPLPGSPAIDAGTDAAASQFATDQRSYPRKVGAHVDIGAVEGIYVAGYSGPGALGNTVSLGNGSFQFGFTNYSDMSLTIWASTNVALPFAQWSNLGAPVESPAGTFTFTDLQATNMAGRFYRVSSP